MNKQIIVVVIILLLLVVSLSGCTEEKGITSDNDVAEEYLDPEQDLPDEEYDEPEDDENHAPNTRDKPCGPTIGNIDVEYTYSQTATDPDGDLVKYRFDWGDGTYSDWSDLREHEHSYLLSHSWSSTGTYDIKIQAMDEHGLTSNWSSSSTVEIREDTGQILSYPQIQSSECSPYGQDINLRPTLKATIRWWVMEEGYDVPESELLLTWYGKRDSSWFIIQTTEIISDGDYYCYFEDADEYSTRYYWKVKLTDKNGDRYDETFFQFTTVQNVYPEIISISPCQDERVPLYPTLSVEISDKYGDAMDLTWYIKQNGIYVVVQVDSNLHNGTYYYKFWTADEYDTEHMWKVSLSDGQSFHIDRNCRFRTIRPEIVISNINPVDGVAFYKHIAYDGTLVAMSPHTFWATISNSEGHNMDVEFGLDTQSHGTIIETFQNVGDGTYSWTPNEDDLVNGDVDKFWVKATDIEWGGYKRSLNYYHPVRRVWVSEGYMDNWINFTKDVSDNSLTVTHVELSDLSWGEIELVGTGVLPTGIIDVGDKITNCSDVVSLRWVAVDMLIDTWMFE